MLASVLAVAAHAHVCLYVCLSVTHQYCIETVAWIEQMYCIQVTVDLCYTLCFKQIRVSPKIRVLQPAWVIRALLFIVNPFFVLYVQPTLDFRSRYQSIVGLSSAILCISVQRSCYLGPLGLWSIVISLSVGASVYMSARITRKPRGWTYQCFCACCPWPWLGRLLTALQYVMYFRFYGWRHVFIPWDLQADGLDGNGAALCSISPVAVGWVQAAVDRPARRLTSSLAAQATTNTWPRASQASSVDSEAVSAVTQGHHSIERITW